MKFRTTPNGRTRRGAAFVLALWMAVAWQQATGQGVDSRLGFSHTAGQLPGLDDGYTRFNSFLPLIDPSEYSLVFADVGFVLFNENTQADGANLGLGVRAFDLVTNRIYGGHFYYDYRDTGHSHYNQLSWGFESLGQVVDYRVNAYLPVGDTWNSYLDSASTTYRGSHLYFTDIPQEVALRGVDTEAVGLLLDQGNWQLRGGAGIYSFWHANTGVAAIGPQARLELRVADQLWINGSLQHDDEFDTTAAVSISWRYGLTRHFERCSSSDSVACRLGDPVERQDQISIKRYIGGPSTDKLVTTADGHAYTFQHVDSSADPGGDGTIESPSHTLAAASNQPEDIVLVHGGSEFVGQQFVASTEGQRVLAEGVPHLLETQAGGILLPEVGNGVSPVISLGGGDAVVIAADGVEVSGFSIVYSSGQPSAPPTMTSYDSDEYGHLFNAWIAFRTTAFVFPGSGIIAREVDDIRINRNFISGARYGIDLRDIRGYSSVQGNTLTSNSQVGIQVVDGFHGVIVANSANGNGHAGLLVHGDVIGSIVDNDLVGNNLAGGGQGGLIVYGDVDGNVSGNLANSNLGYGVLIGGEVSGRFASNSAEAIGADDHVSDGVFGGHFQISTNIAWFAADLPDYDANEYGVLNGIDSLGLSRLISNERRRVGVPLLVRGAVGGEVFGNVGSVTAGVNLDPNPTIEYPAMELHSLITAPPLGEGPLAGEN